jgi:hypothetical protein
MRRLFACCSALTAVALTAPATAKSPSARDAGLSAAALLGVVWKDNVNLGLGARIGYTLPDLPFYFGGTFIYHPPPGPAPIHTPHGDSSERLYYYGVEVGYAFAVGPVIVRPYLGLGPATATTSVPCGGPCLQVPGDTKPAAWAGGTLLFPMGSAFVGGDARMLVVQNHTVQEVFGAFATGGLHF